MTSVLHCRDYQATCYVFVLLCLLFIHLFDFIPSRVNSDSFLVSVPCDTITYPLSSVSFKAANTGLYFLLNFLYLPLCSFSIKVS